MPPLTAWAGSNGVGLAYRERARTSGRAWHSGRDSWLRMSWHDRTYVHITYRSGGDVYIHDTVEVQTAYLAGSMRASEDSSCRIGYARDEILPRARTIIGEFLM